MGSHIVDGEFQSDKYPDCPPGKVPLSVKDPMAQDLLWEYSIRRESVDAEFAADLREALVSKGYVQHSNGCDCHRIMALDSTRHFRGCSMREKYPTHAAEKALPDALVLKLVPTDDKELSCVLCHGDMCDLESTFLVDGPGGGRSRISVGLHKRCRELAEKSQKR